MEEINYQQKFEELFCTHIKREGAQQLLEWLKKTDFFSAPASTKYHCACQHGLVMHSISVFETMAERFFEEGDSMESFAICGLLHDVCKVNCYHTETRRRKNPETGYWEDYQTYAFRDHLPLGHGEKSLYLIQRHMDLEPEEALAIRWHMGAYDNAAKGDGRALSAAMAASPWVWRLQQADMCAAWVDEREAAEE